MKSLLQKVPLQPESDPIDNRSEAAVEVCRIKAVAFDVAENRERIPQPLFWSLLHSQLDKIREVRKKAENERRIVYKTEW
jgi:hypothetical protein